MSTKQFGEPTQAPAGAAVARDRDGTRKALLDVGAVVVTHQRLDLTRRCVESLSTELDGSQIVVILNCPDSATDDDLTWLRTRVGSVVLNRHLLGYGANVNEGARHLPEASRYCLVLNDDALVESGAVSILREALESRPQMGLAGPQLIDEEGRPLLSRARFPSPTSELVGVLLAPARVEERLARRFVNLPDTGDDDVPAWPIGAAFLSRLDAFRQVEGFDESYFLYSEETDLAFRLATRGWGSCFCPDAIVVHIGAQSTSGGLGRELGLSRWRYIRGHWTWQARSLFMPLLAVAYLWNTFYVIARIAASPTRYREKVSWWHSRWVRRPAPSFINPLLGQPTAMSVPSAREDRERRFWDDHIRSLDECLEEHGSGPAGNTLALIEALEPLEGSSVLDVGCGTGVLAAWLAERGAVVTAVDVSPESIVRARELFDRLDLEIECVCAAYPSREFHGRVFDRLCGRYVLHHLDIAEVAPFLAESLSRNGRAAFLETMQTNPMLAFARRQLAGRFGIARYGTPDECPLTRDDLSLLSNTVGPLRIVVTDMNCARLIDRQVFKYRSRMVSRALGAVDSALLRAGLEAASYHQVLIMDGSARP